MNKTIENIETIYMNSLGWLSTKDLTDYIDNQYDWVLIVLKSNNGEFFVPKVAEYSVKDNKWFDEYSNVVDETIDKVSYWKPIGPNPNIMLDEVRKLLQNDYVKNI